MKKENENKPDPFVKWVGGKRQLLPIIRKNIPSEIDRYIEPFLGGGAVLYNIDYNSAFANDINKELITTYKTVKENISGLVEKLKEHKQKNCENYYYEIRSLKTEDLTELERAARFIYLNKTCFNGVYRENSKGEFNVPFGKQANPNILDENNLIQINKIFNIKNINFFNLNFK